MGGTKTNKEKKMQPKKKTKPKTTPYTMQIEVQ